jgi:hypothetical protein
MGNRVILDNADAGTVVDTYFNSKVVCVWVRGAGTAEILHDGDVIVELVSDPPDITPRKVVDGLGIATGVQARAVTSGVTLMFDDG